MIFDCSRSLNGTIDQWKGRIEYYNKRYKQLEMYICSRSSIHIIIGVSEYGHYICIPNFNAGCYLSNFDDVFWNSEKLIDVIGEVDGITVAKAIDFISREIELWN